MEYDIRDDVHRENISRPLVLLGGCRRIRRKRRAVRLLFDRGCVAASRASRGYGRRRRLLRDGKLAGFASGFGGDTPLGIGIARRYNFVAFFLHISSFFG